MLRLSLLSKLSSRITPPWRGRTAAPSAPAAGPSQTGRRRSWSKERRHLFLSYRRSDSMSASGRIYERLAKRYGKQHVFKDVDTLQGGDDFAKTIQQTIQGSAAALVVIGRGWLETRDEAGQRRLEDPEDSVRREVESAFDDGVPVVPILVEGAHMPEAGQLPASLAQLPAIQAVVVNNDPDFEAGVRRLIRAVDPLLPPGMRPQVRRRRAIAGVLGALCLVALLLAGLRPLVFPVSEPYGGPATAHDALSQVVTLPSGSAGKPVDAWAVGHDGASNSGGFILHESGGAGRRSTPWASPPSSTRYRHSEASPWCHPMRAGRWGTRARCYTWQAAHGQPSPRPPRRSCSAWRSRPRTRRAGR